MDEQWERIYLQDLRADCIIGAREAERRQKQEVGIDICLEVDVREAGRSDRLEDTVDYGVLARQVIATVEETSFQLLSRRGSLARDLSVCHISDTQMNPTVSWIARCVLLSISRTQCCLAREHCP